MKQKIKGILVTGDVIVDHHMYQGERLVPDSIKPVGTKEKKAHGGAGLLFQILQSVSKQKSKQKGEAQEFAVQFGLKNNIFGKLHPNLHGYALWKLCRPEGGEKENVWRMVLPFGYGSSSRQYFPYSSYVSEAAAANYNILVVDDGGLGFRHKTEKEAWPGMLKTKKTSGLEWIVLKMSSPVGQGDLWHLLSSDFKNHLVVIISIDDIRREEVRVSKGISWERTALDLLEELSFNPAINRLLNCKHLIINFGSEGAVYLENAHSRKRFWLIYDTANMEGEWGDKIEGKGLGYMSCLTAGIVNQLTQSDHHVNIIKGIQAGLSSMRTMHLKGHGTLKSKSIGFPFGEVAVDILQPSWKFSTIQMPQLKKSDDASKKNWTIMTAYLEGVKKNPRPLYGVGRRVALLGPKALTHIPYSQFGKLFTVDRNEIESLRNIQKLMTDYEKYDKGEKPLSLAVFGPPGSGKSFGIIQIAKGVLGQRVPILEFNLSQFADPAELLGAFHQVRDKVLEGATPIVFWDEFDSKEYMWLQYLLSPMQDGRFHEGQITHPIGKCVFIFAGGTSYRMENFGPSKDEKEIWRQFKLKKGPDFLSRLSGYLNVLGPNRRQYFDTKTREWMDYHEDVCFPVRRALLLRAVLRLDEKEYLNIDRGMLSAFIEIDKYRHGARSLEKILSSVRQPGMNIIRRSDLPSPDITSLHVNYENFINIVNRDLEFKTKAEDLAPYVHEYWRHLGRKEGWLRPELDKDYQDLTENYKEDNRAAAVRIPQVLDLVGLYIVPESFPEAEPEEEINAIIEQNLELLAEVEHNGWVEQKLKNGWRLGERNDDKKTHNCLIPYEKMSKKDQDKDRNSVLKYPEILKIAKYKIVSSLNVE